MAGRFPQIASYHGSPEIVVRTRTTDERGERIVPPPFRQEGGTCTANAIVMAVEIHRRLRSYRAGVGFEEPPLSVDAYVRAHAVQRLNNGVLQWDHGTHDENFHWCATTGIPFENGRGSLQVQWNRADASDLRFISEQIRRHGPVLASMAVDGHFCNPFRRGIYRGFADPAEYLGNHMIVVTGVGIERRDIGDNYVFEFISSHGPEWGYGGSGFVDASWVPLVWVMEPLP